MPRAMYFEFIRDRSGAITGHVAIIKEEYDIQGEIVEEVKEIES